jgi:hypothetical protein
MAARSMSQHVSLEKRGTTSIKDLDFISPRIMIYVKPWD